MRSAVCFLLTAISAISLGSRREGLHARAILSRTVSSLEATLADVFVIARRYSVCVANLQTIPDLWLLSDERNDRVLEQALADLPEGSGFVFRHYHLTARQRKRRFDALAAVARASGHIVTLADDLSTAIEWGAVAVYGPPGRVGSPGPLLRIATVHDRHEIAHANRIMADAVMLSPVFATRSHPGGNWLGPRRFHELAECARMPVIALGGMTAERASDLDWQRWAAIDGLSSHGS